MTRVLLDSQYKDIADQVTITNTLIKQLAPVINAPFANGYFTATGSIDAMAKYKANDGFYIFAGVTSNTQQTSTFTVKSGSSVTVLNESRTIPIVGGKFTDTFAGRTGVHIYKINQ